MKNKRVTVFGGSGFLGSVLVRKLAEEGVIINVICRNTDAAKHLQTSGDVGQIVTSYGNIRDKDAVDKYVQGSDIVINLVGIMNPHGKDNFSTIHAQGAENIATACSKYGISRLVHISALGVDKPSGSKYARTKITGEQAVMAAFPKATIFRPSIMFGHADHFFNMLAGLLVVSPVMPLMGGGRTKFQPVYVGDVADAITAALKNPDTEGKIYELGGPAVFSFKEIIVFILKAINRKCLLINYPFFLASIMASFLEILPNPPLTRDQVKLLKVDNIVDKSALTFPDLGITPKSVEAIVPEYLQRFKK